MTKPATPSSPKPAGDDRNLVAVDENYVAMSFEDKLQIFWKNNGTAVLAACGVILLAIVGWGVWGKVQESNERGIEQDYAAATTSVQRKAFIAAHADHSLAGLAQLILADEAYAAGKAADAVTGYEQALRVIKTGPLAARAHLGHAMAGILAGKSPEGTAELKQLAGDVNQLKGVRVEAAYQLASLAAEGGNAADVQKYSDQLMQLDPSSPWTQRSLALRMSLPMPATAAAPVPAGTEPKKPEAASAMQIKLPGK
jgi:predicted negative regulator of RcsB-dependent stress response